MSNRLISTAPIKVIFWIVTLFTWCSLSYAAPHIYPLIALNTIESIDTLPLQLPEIILVDASSESTGVEHTMPKDGALIIPDDDSDKLDKKKCMTVCEQWGQDCVVNPKTGSRRCRRTCKQFGEECF